MAQENKDWTIEQDDYLEKYYLVKSDKEIANDLNKKETQVKCRRYELGFKKQRQTFHKGTPEGMKWCWHCNEFHPKEEFSKNKRRPDGLQDECKMAVKLMVLKRKANKSKNNKNLTEKFCEGCQTTKNINKFIKNVSTKDGYSNLCKDCLNKNDIERKYKILEGK